MATTVTVNVHPDASAFEVREYPDCPSGPFVAVELGSGVALLIPDPEVMAGLVHLIKSAEQQLIDLHNGTEQAAAGEPVGDTGLFLHPLLVGES